MTGRSLLGGQPPKGQQLEDHYFGSIAARVQSFMSEMEYELFKLGVPVKTRHNEVAPAQFECAPIFEEADIATDHNQLVMEVLRKVSVRHGFSALLHEKPFAGVNGSGKHCNWSLMITASGQELEGTNLLEPGKTPSQNLRFLLLLSAILKGVHRHSGLLRAGIASAGNDHRLGANEAPPAIISVFLGDMLDRILNEIEKGTGGDQNIEAAVIRLGVNRLPEIMPDNNDRNRTSPMAFTGNKFEFRAVGSSASVAFPVTLMNAAVSDGLIEIIASLRKRLNAGKALDGAILETVREAVTETKTVRFEGNNYAEEWIREAERRGLPHHRKTPEALTEIKSEQSIDLLDRLGIFSEQEVRSRFHVRVERYLKNLEIEADTLRSLVDTMVLPACYAYHAGLAHGASAAKSIGLPVPQAESLTRLTNLLTSLNKARQHLEVVVNRAEGMSDEVDKARLFSTEVATAMQEVRSASDGLEAIVADDYWPLPKYREMLFLY
jgi:glutamine synthetase